MDVASPCIKLCKLNEEKNCIGCFRTVSEITAWRHLTNDERQVILENLTQRGYYVTHIGTE